MTLQALETVSAKGSPRQRLLRAFSPVVVLILTVLCLPLALVTTLAMPVGSMYWDHFIYLDAANRIFDGQIPSVDFFAPVGGLGYYLFAGWLYLFPQGHPLLLSSWSLLTVTAPLMALIVWNIQKSSTATAYGVLLPFLLFSLLPFNTGDFYPYPGSDGFGIYNRQICQLLYVLAAALVFMKGWKTLGTVTALAMLGLFFTKITGVAAGTVLCLMAFLSGRLGFRAAVLAGAIFAVAIAGLEIVSGSVSAYVTDILALLSINDGSLLPRLVQAASLNFGVVLSTVLFALWLFLTGLAGLRTDFSAFAAKPGPATFTRLADKPFLWLASFVAAGLLFESQNTGSQAFTFLWPLLLAIIIESYRRYGHARAFAVMTVLVMAAALPPAVTIVQKAARAWVGSLTYQSVEYRNLKSLGAVRARDIIEVRAARLKSSYLDHRDAYQALAASGELPSFLLYSDFEFQLLVLQTLDEAVSALLAYEAANNVRFETMMTIDFTNPLPWLMDRHAPKYIAIGADPYRAVPPLDERVRTEVAAVDIALYPTCPPTTARLALLNIYAPILTSSHRRITLTPCFDAFVRNTLDVKP